MVAGAHAVESAHLWRRSVAQPALSGDRGFSIGRLNGDANSFLGIHVWARVRHGEPANNEAGSVNQASGSLTASMQIPPQYAMFPALNAALNGSSAVLLLAGRWFISRGRMAVHRAFMIAALVTSSLFLISYLYYHAHVGSVHFQGQGWARPVYFTILISHTILAALVVPMVIITLSRALRERFDRHRAIARWTFPVWMYVSVTGVVVYVMLYHLC